MSSKYHLSMIPGIWSCQLCEWSCDGSHPNQLMTHLHDVHGIKRRKSNIGGSFGEYLKDFFPVPKCCCGCGKDVNLHGREFGYALFAIGCNGMHRARNPACIEFYLHKNMSVDDAIIALSERQSSTAKKHSTEELKQFLRECNAGTRNPASYKSIIRRTGKSRRQIQSELSKKTKGENNGFACRIHTNATMLKTAKSRSQQSKIVTKPELVMWAWLQTFDITFERELPIDRFVVDYLFRNIIIEVYGDYWHSDRMSNSGMIFNKPQQDAIKNEMLHNLGYIVHVFWESEIMKTPKESYSRLCKIINEN